MSTEQTSPQLRDYSSISPSARFLLQLKGLTDIPYAKAAAALAPQPAEDEPGAGKKDFMFWIRVLLFESRYRSINQLLSGLAVKHVLELSSGFSFRGLAAVQDQDLYYIDTDLPEVIHTKRDMAAALQDKAVNPKGKLEILPLNALDEKQFTEIISRFPEGEIVIVNEGLLMYFDTTEKKKLCGIIHNVLRQRGGCWITADIYVKANMDMPRLETNDTLRQFFETHHIRDNMFDSFEAAEAFFKQEGFVIDKEAEPEYANSSSLKYLRESDTEGQLSNAAARGKIQATWRLKADV